MFLVVLLVTSILLIMGGLLGAALNERAVKERTDRQAQVQRDLNRQLMNIRAREAALQARTTEESQ